MAYKFNCKDTFEKKRGLNNLPLNYPWFVIQGREETMAHVL